MPEKTRFLGVISLLTATLFYGLYGVYSRFIGLDFGVFFQVLARNSIILICLASYLVYTRSWQPINRDDLKWFGLMSLPGLVAVAASFVAFNHLAIGTTLFLFYASATLGGYLIGHVFFQERLTRVKIISLTACLLGLLVIFGESLKAGSLFYLLLASLAGLGSASWNSFSKKISSKYPLAEVFFVDTLISATISCLLIFLLKEPLTSPSLSISWVAVLLFGLTTLAAASLTINGFRYLQAQIGSLIMLLEPVFGILWGWLFFRETLTSSSWIGGLFILSGVAFANLASKKNEGGG